MTEPLRLVHRVEPVYPRNALEQKISGTVLLEITIEKNGTVIDARIIKTDHEILNDAAMIAVKKWIYIIPAVFRNKNQFPVKKAVMIEFILPN